VAKVVFTVSNICAMLHHVSHDHRGTQLRWLGADVLTRLTVDADACERIDGTGSVVMLLLDMFLLQPTGEATDATARVEVMAAIGMGAKAPASLFVNRLTGAVPQSFVALAPTLQKLNLSRNVLSSEIPHFLPHVPMALPARPLLQQLHQ
jgi:hypothetical protein